MIIDMLNGFKDYYKKNGDKVILDQYKMKQGLYILINSDGIKDTLHILAGAKEKDFSGDQLQLFNYFKERDYLSILVLYDTNKKVASKSIHSNNTFTLFARKKSFFNKDDINSSMIKAVNEYFEAFEKYHIEENSIKNCKKELKPKEEILKKAPDFNDYLADKSRTAFENTLPEILHLDIMQEVADDDYIRVFFEADLEDYNDEYKRYMVRKVFNKDKYHIFRNGEVVGLSNIDMGTNPNKPSLELKTMKVKAPFKLNFENALIAQKLFDFLFFYNVNRKNKTSGEIEKVSSIYKTLYIPYDFNIDGIDLTKYSESNKPIHYVKTGNGISFNIVDYDILAPFSKKIDFEFENFLDDTADIEEYISKGKKLPYKTIGFLYQLESTVDYYFFFGKMVNNYFEDKIKISSDKISKNLINLMYVSRNAFYEWFRQGNAEDISYIIDYITYRIMEEHLNSIKDVSELLRIKPLFNLRFSLLQYFKIGGLEILDNLNEIKSSLFLAINSKNDCVLESNAEFFFLTGQLTYFLLTKSESANKTHLMISPIVKCKDINSIKIKLDEMYQKYKHAISLNDFRFNNAYSLIAGYQGNAKLKDYKDVLMAGILSKNIMFKKNKKTISTRKDDINGKK